MKQTSQTLIVNRHPGRLARLLCIIALLASAWSGHGADVVVNPAQTYQAIEGWGHGGGILGGTTNPYLLLGPALADPVNTQYLDYLVDELGLTGTRTWEVGPRIDGTGNDHGDCDEIDWKLFQGDTLRPSDAAYLVYFQNRILAQGCQPSIYSSPGYPTHASDVKPWVMNHPGERAQQLWASALYLKSTYGLNINYGVIYNEPSIAASILADDIKAIAPRMAAHGLATRVQYAEAVAPQNDWNYITPAMNDPAIWPLVGRISYHNYGTADPYRANLRDWGKARGLMTAQTEMGDPTFDDLYSDLTLGGVSYWEVAYASSVTLVPSAGLTSFTPGNRFFRLRQLLHYVRPGAVRIGAAACDPTLRVLAFSKGGKVTTIIENTSSSAQTINLSGLPPGDYGVSKSGGNLFQELGVQTVGAAGTLTLTNLPGNSAVTTLYPYAGPNHPPTIMTWGTNPGYLVAPAAAATLSVSANDAELDPLTYAWSVTSQPPGANALLATPALATTSVSGLSVPGAYVFNVDVSDGTNTSSKHVYLVVYDSNPPPVLGQSGFRIAAPYGLVFGDSSGVTHAHIELPTSAVTLQVGISDLASSDFTGRGQWSVVSQPPGANVTLGPTTYIYVSIRAQVTGMTVPGDYTFQLDVSNPGHVPLTAQISCTVHPASSAPVISSITPAPASLTLPAGTTQLTAVTSSSTGQLLRHWWVMKNGPAGARPLFDHQGLSSTTVSNLILPGAYTFTLRAFDDLHMTTKDVNVSVSPTPGAPVITNAAVVTVIAGTPFSYTLAASTNPTSFSVGALAPGLSFDNGMVTGTPTMPGLWHIPLYAANASGVGYGNLALTVNLPAPAITSSLAADGLVNSSFNYTVSATNCPVAYNSSGLPAGLWLNAATGLISGTPTAAGVTTATIAARNASGTTSATMTFALYASAPPAPVITSALTITATVGTSFNYTIAATNTPTRYLAVGLPPGLSFDPASPVIIGVPHMAGTFNVTLEADNRGGIGTATLVLNVAPNPNATTGGWASYK